jgi:hypothetical protein
MDKKEIALGLMIVFYISRPRVIYRCLYLGTYTQDDIKTQRFKSPNTKCSTECSSKLVSSASLSYNLSV